MKSHSPEIRGASGGVLIVERDYFVAQELRSAFQSLGAPVCGATADPEVAARLALAHATRLALLDLTLGPDLIFDLAESLRQRSVRVVFTAGGEPCDPPAALSSLPLVRKPFEAGALASRLLQDLSAEQRDVSFSNQLLQRLPAPLIAAAQAHMSRVKLSLGAQLVAYGSTLRHFWFIESGVCALSPLRDSAVATAMVGVEGVVGACSLLGVGEAVTDCRVIFAGEAIRAPAPVMFRLLEAYPEARELMLSYAHTLYVQTASTALSASALSIQQRVARWLLLASDRVGENLAATHELIADTLNVRRAGVTEALQSLEAAGLIERRRGVVRIMGRTLLAACAGASYGAAEREYQRLFQRA